MSRLRQFPALSSRHARIKPLPIEDYALIGDLHSAGLVGIDGTVDWLCLPAFSSDACFAALLGMPENGRWLLRPMEAIRNVTRRYRPATLILETTMETDGGTVVLTDLMPIRENNEPNLVRIVDCVRGKVKLRSEFIIRFDYGRAVPWVTTDKDGLRAVVGPDALNLRTPASVHGEDLSSVAEFTLREGESMPFVLTYTQSHVQQQPKLDWLLDVPDTEKFWQEWCAKSQYRGEFHEVVQRSLITVKALTYRPSGGIIAAPTTSLPEQLGGVRNWDYRYCWLRDTTFTLLALLNAGYREEGQAWHDWLLRALAGQTNQIQIVYGICGERRLPEQTLEHLDGYAGSRPVRLGNGASSQVQLDVYGEVLDAMFHAVATLKIEGHEIGEKRMQENIGIMLNLLSHLEKSWQQPDRGIWEFRTRPKHYTYSKVMAWVAFDRALSIAKVVPPELSKDLPLRRWEKIREKIHRDVCKYGFSRSMNSFTQSFGSRKMDASLLLIALVGFLPPEDARIVGTIDAVAKQLTKNGLLIRYHSGPSMDDLPAGEGAFLACSFWMVSCLQLIGRTSEARTLFDRVLSLRNDVGLLSEEYDTESNRQVGNFPQAFSHISMLHAAYALSSKLETLRSHVRHDHRAMVSEGPAHRDSK